MSSPDDSVAGRRGEFEDDLLDVPHDSGDPLETAPRRALDANRRIIGIDFARALALLGMMVVHIMASTTSAGAMTWDWRLSAGNAAALFALIAGVGIALFTGGANPPRGRRLVGSMVGLLFRAVLIGAAGLALGMVVTSQDAQIILPYYAVLFVLAIPFLRLPAPLLAVLGIAVAIGVPFWSHFARQGLPVLEPANLTFAAVAADPSQAATRLLLTGVYPALPWMAYLLLGLALGRLPLRRWTQLWFFVGGTVLALLATAGSRYVMYTRGGLDQLAAVSQETMALEDFRRLLIFGADGTLPTDSLWWLGVLAPHTTTPFDLLHTLGIAVAVLAASMMMGVVLPGAMRPLAILGSMPLTTYSLHLVLLRATFLPQTDWQQFLIHAVALFLFAFVWSRWFSRGPLEAIVHVFSGGIRDLIAGKR